MMAARLPYLDREQVPPDVQAVYDKMKKATGRVLNTFRLMAHHARSVAPVRDAARGRARPQAAPARLREGLTDQWLQLLSDAQRGPRAEGRSAEGEVRCAGRLHDQPALLRSRAIGHPLCGGDDRKGPSRFAARGR